MTYMIELKIMIDKTSPSMEDLRDHISEFYAKLEDLNTVTNVFVVTESVQNISKQGF